MRDSGVDPAGVEAHLPGVRHGQDDVTADELGPVQAVAVGRGEEPGPVATLAVHADGALERGDAGPVQRVGMDGDVVALDEHPHPVVQPPDHDRADRRDRGRIAAARGERVEAALDRVADRDRLRRP